MLNRLRQLNKLWKLAKKSKGFQEVLQNLDNDDLKEIPDEDTKAVFLPDMTEDEYNDYVRSEIKGWKVFDEKLRKIINGRK